MGPVPAVAVADLATLGQKPPPPEPSDIAFETHFEHTEQNPTLNSDAMGTWGYEYSEHGDVGTDVVAAVAPGL